MLMTYEQFDLIKRAISNHTQKLSSDAWKLRELGVETIHPSYKELERLIRVDNEALSAFVKLYQSQENSSY